MPKNKGAGGKKFRKGKTESQAVKRELVFKEEGQAYGMATKMLGSCNVSLKCDDNIVRMGHVRGSMRKNVWVNINDTVLVGLRDYQDGKCDILHVYDADEVRCLSSYNELPANWNSNVESVIDQQNDDEVAFGHTNDSDNDESVDIDEI